MTEPEKDEWYKKQEELVKRYQKNYTCKDCIGDNGFCINPHGKSKDDICKWFHLKPDWRMP